RACRMSSCAIQARSAGFSTSVVPRSVPATPRTRGRERTSFSTNISENLDRERGVMADPCIVKLAQVLVHYSIPVKAADWFILSGSDLAAPLIREVYREALLVGAHIETRVGIEGLAELLYKHGT